MATGKVKWFNDKKGFGFLLDEEEKDVFVHFSVIEGEGYKTLREDDVVEFECEQGPKGMFAAKVIKPAEA